MTMGSDFQYENALSNFKNLDKLIKYVNAEVSVSQTDSNYPNYKSSKQMEAMSIPFTQHLRAIYMH